jgi:hypothetical protein
VILLSVAVSWVASSLPFSLDSEEQDDTYDF